MTLTSYVKDQWSLVTLLLLYKAVVAKTSTPLTSYFTWFSPSSIFRQMWLNVHVALSAEIPGHFEYS